MLIILQARTIRKADGQLEFNGETSRRGPHKQLVGGYLGETLVGLPSSLRSVTRLSCTIVLCHYCGICCEQWGLHSSGRLVAPARGLNWWGRHGDLLKLPITMPFQAWQFQRQLHLPLLEN